VRAAPPVSYDPRKPDAPVRLYATGVREAYDLLWHSNGSLYAGVNMNDTGNFTPQRDGLPAVNVRPDEPLVRIVEGKYYGHPNPARGEYVLMGGNPTEGKDPWEIAKLPVGTKPEPAFDPSLLLFNLVPVGGQSANGCAEWTPAGPMRGWALFCFYTSARTVHAFRFSPDGTKVVDHAPLAGPDGKPLKFGAPLDLAVHPSGRAYVVDFEDPRRGDSGKTGGVWVVEPVTDRRP
jgi:large repetitive protein